ncbi:hypothetical protein [Thalassospira povalilytica]|uniref:hypothetical protein n=1 Tax=Thalassospira povalilytica TaxID=732237 RepID=UPI001D181224|nr:hypothetical protein [Thalassospira povalilytica]MCC4240337.1 hypothetical protein [Thalassospira povalilytica]
MCNYPMTVECEFRIFDNNGTFSAIKLYQDGEDVIIEQDQNIHRISTAQFSDLMLCMNLLDRQMSRSGDDD